MPICKKTHLLTHIWEKFLTCETCSKKFIFTDELTHTGKKSFTCENSKKKFIKAIDPCLLITMETEIWPNLYKICNQHGVPILLVNARLSKKSMKGYKLFSDLIASTIKLVDKIAAQTQMEADRFIMLGAENKDVSVVGNIKYHFDIRQSFMEEA